MTLMFTPIVGLLAGLILGRRREGYAVTALTWYLALAVQTIYLAKPGATDLIGRRGNTTVRWPLYWLTQPPILALALALLLVGAVVRDRLRHKLDPTRVLNEST
jgi:hypothetical protein